MLVYVSPGSRDKWALVMKNKLASIMTVLSILIVSIFISAVIQQDHIIRYKFHPQDKEAIVVQSNRTYLNDNYHYYITIKQTIGKYSYMFKLLKMDPRLFGQKASIFGGTVSSVFMGALSVAATIDYFLARIVHRANLAVLLSFIFQSSMVIFAFLLAFGALIQKSMSWFTMLMVGFLTAIFLDPFLVCSYNGFSNLSHYYNAIFASEPNILRLVNPQMGWMFALLYLATLLFYLKLKKPLLYWILLFSSILLGLFSLHLAATLVVAMTIYLVIYWLKIKRLNLHFFGLLFLLFLSLIFSYSQLYAFSGTAMGQELGVGGYLSLVVKWHYLYFLILIPFICYSLSGETKYFMVALLMASIIIGMLCDSVHLGSRMWVRGAGIYVWLILVFIAANYIIQKVTLLYVYLNNKMKGCVFTPAVLFVQASIVVFCVFYVNTLLHINLQSSYGFIDKDKWSVLEWLGQKENYGKIVASENIEDSFLLLAYTKSHPVVLLYTTSNLSHQEIISRYFYVLSVFGDTDRYMRLIKEYKYEDLLYFWNYVAKKSNVLFPYDQYQANAFYTMLIYYPYTSSYKEIFTNVSERKRFNASLRKAADNAPKTQYYYDYILIDKRHNKNIKYDPKYKIFENKTYLIISRP